MLTQTAAKPPVGTNSPQKQKASGGNADGGKPLTQTRPAKFDKVSYQRVYMAKWRAEIKSGKRVPKRKGETT